MEASAHSCIEKITGTLYKKSSAAPGISGGHGALLLYQYELQRAASAGCYTGPLPSSATTTHQPQLLDNGDEDDSLLSGRAGIVWLCRQLSSCTAGSSVSTTSQQYEQLTAGAINMLKQRRYGCTDGAYGILHCLLLAEQLPDVQALADRILSAIGASYVKGDLYSAFGSGGPEAEISLGLYSGISGCLLVLVKACRMGYDSRHSWIRGLLSEGVAYILHHKMDIDYEDGCYSFFPQTVKRNSNYVETANRLSLVNSDLNHVLLLYEMHLLTGDRHYRDLAAYIGLQTISRRDFEATMVNDTGLFSGSAGIAMLYKKLSSYGNREEFMAAARYWMQRTIDDVLAADADTVTANEKWLSEGAAGTSLCILAFMCQLPPVWTELFFL